MTDSDHLPNRKDTKFKPGWKGGPGRPPKLKTQVKSFIKDYPYAVETLMTTLYEMGIKGDREAAIYIIDRIKGKPKVITGLDEQDRNLLKAQTVLEFWKLIENHDKGEPLQLPEVIEGEVIDVRQEEGTSTVEETETA